MEDQSRENDRLINISILEFLCSIGMDLASAIAETETAVQLFLENKFELAEQKMAEHAHCSLYHALGHGTILFIQATMSFERTDMDKAMSAVIRGCALANRLRARHSFAYELLSRLKGQTVERCMDNEQLHAELCHSELLLARALLSFFSDESLASLIRGAFRIRSCFSSFKELHRLLSTGQLDSNQQNNCHGDEEGEYAGLRRQFEAGVRGGFGLFNLVLSAMPAKLSAIMHLVGFAGDKTMGMSELLASANMESTLRSPLAAMALLCHQLVVTFLIGAEKPDLELCARLLAPLTRQYPNGAIILFLRARFRLIGGHLDEALQLYHRSIRAQRVYRQFHHICHWELLIANALLLHWDRAAWHAKKLLDENRWSKCVYSFWLAILVDSDRKVEKRKKAVSLLMRRVPAHRLKIAGKSIPIEKFCERRALKWLEAEKRDDIIQQQPHGGGGTLLLPQIEFLYLWNGFALLEHCSWLVCPILDFIDTEWQHWQLARLVAGGGGDTDSGMGLPLYTFLRAVCHRTLGQLEKAEDGFETVIQSEPQLPAGNCYAYLLPNACLELALTRLAMCRAEETVQPLLHKALSYRGYALETKLHFRVHSAIQRLDQRHKN